MITDSLATGTNTTEASAGKRTAVRPSLKRGYKINEAAEYLGISPISVRRAIERGLLKPSRVFRHPIIPVTQLDALLSRGEA